MCELVPDSVGLVKAYGHEIGCHSYSHAQDKALDVLSYEEQLNEIKKAKRILYTPKSTSSAMLGFMKGVDFIGERLPLINEFAAIIVCKGGK